MRSVPDLEWNGDEMNTVYQGSQPKPSEINHDNNNYYIFLATLYTAIGSAIAAILKN